MEKDPFDDLLSKLMGWLVGIIVVLAITIFAIQLVVLG